MPSDHAIRTAASRSTGRQRERMLFSHEHTFAFTYGDDGTRTRDLLVASQMLSRLSYIPILGVLFEAAKTRKQFLHVTGRRPTSPSGVLPSTQTPQNACVFQPKTACVCRPPYVEIVVI